MEINSYESLYETMHILMVKIVFPLDKKAEIVYHLQGCDVLLIDLSCEDHIFQIVVGHFSER